MYVTSSLENLPSGKSLTLALGNFDGVHRGHRKLIEFAQREQGLVGVMTFCPHPVSILAPQRDLHQLTDKKLKTKIFKELGLDFVVFYPFDKKFATFTPMQFAKMVGSIKNLKTLVTGEDFHFGRHREGNPAKLRQLVRKFGVELKIFPPLCHAETKISSSRIRQLLLKGEVQTAAYLLGRDYNLRGKVVSGDGVGRNLGYPTANIETSQLTPARGVYSGEIKVHNGRFYPAAISIGSKKTLQTQSSEVLEVHIVDFNGNLYGKELEVVFKCRLRSQKQFSGVQELTRQINRDVQRVINQAANNFVDC